MGYSFQLTARVLLYAPSHRQLNEERKCFIYGYMALDKWLGTTEIMREETCCFHLMGYSFQLAMFYTHKTI